MHCLRKDSGRAWIFQCRALWGKMFGLFSHLSPWPRGLWRLHLAPCISAFHSSFLSPMAPQATLQTQSFLAELILWKFWRTKEMSVALVLVIIWSSAVVYFIAKSVSAWRIQFFKSFVLFPPSSFPYIRLKLRLLQVISIKLKYIFDTGGACLQSE